MFNQESPTFREALNKVATIINLILIPRTQRNLPKRKKRNRNVTRLNPPYNSTVKTNKGKEFLKLVDECFPPHHPLSKIVNRKTIKVSYSTTPNMAKIISSRNSKILSEKEAPKRACSCPKNATCPLNGQCLESSIVYNAKITQSQSDQKVTNYIGMTSTEFKQAQLRLCKLGPGTILIFYNSFAPTSIYM